MTTEATLTALITPRLKKFHKALAASVPSRGADGDAVGVLLDLVFNASGTRVISILRIVFSPAAAFPSH